MLPRTILRRCVPSPSLISSRFYGSSNEKAFPVLEQPLEIKDDSALQKSKKAEEAFMKTLFVCQSGGGEKGAHKHAVINKKVLVRDRIKHILDDESGFFEVGTTAGLGLDYGDVPGAGTVTGIGMVRGILVMIVASDGSLKGGTSYPITVTKSLRAQVCTFKYFKSTYTTMYVQYISINEIKNFIILGRRRPKSYVRGRSVYLTHN